MKYDLNILNNYINDGLLEVQHHKIYPLSIYTYSRNCQFDKKWNDILIQMRGTILDNKGNLIAKSFNKFFNWEELDINNIPWDSQQIHIQDKVDGSLGIIFYYNNKWLMCTKGSFESNQAIKGMEILKSKYDTNKFLPSVTYLCEIIYPENKIVLDYKDEEKLIFLSALWNNQELNWENTKQIFHTSGIKDVDIVHTKTIQNIDSQLIKNLKEQNISNKEGYVIRFNPSNFRLKVKFDDYVRLHKLKSNLNEKHIWECLLTNTSLELNDIPDEWDNYIKETKQKLQQQYNDKLNEIQFNYNHIITTMEYEKLMNKKEFALEVQKYPKWMQGFLFALANGKKFETKLWKLLKP